MALYHRKRGRPINVVQFKVGQPFPFPIKEVPPTGGRLSTRYYAAVRHCDLIMFDGDYVEYEHDVVIDVWDKDEFEQGYEPITEVESEGVPVPQQADDQGGAVLPGPAD